VRSPIKLPGHFDPFDRKEEECRGAVLVGVVAQKRRDTYH